MTDRTEKAFQKAREAMGLTVNHIDEISAPPSINDEGLESICNPVPDLIEKQTCEQTSGANKALLVSNIQTDKNHMKGWVVSGLLLIGGILQWGKFINPTLAKVSVGLIVVGTIALVIETQYMLGVERKRLEAIAGYSSDTESKWINCWFSRIFHAVIYGIIIVVAGIIAFCVIANPRWGDPDPDGPQESPSLEIHGYPTPRGPWRLKSSERQSSWAGGLDKGHSRILPSAATTSMSPSWKSSKSSTGVSSSSSWASSSSW